MCGIVGCAGFDAAGRVLLRGLKRLEYRGYDSAGLAAGNGDGSIRIVKRSGQVDELAEDAALDGRWGLGHTRWATHGAPTETNAHPHVSCEQRFAVVHNGIIENHAALRDELEARGHAFASETDTEVVVHLLEEAYGGDLAEAMLEVRDRLEGSYALAAICADEPDVVVAARQQSPLVVGLTDDGTLLGSDVTPLLDHTDRVVYLQDGDVARLRPDDLTVFGRDGGLRDVEPTTVPWTVEDAEKGGYPHYMLKEIHEQPKVLRDVIRTPLAGIEDDLGIQGDAGGDLLADVDRLVLLAMGTSYNAGLIAKPVIEELADVPVEVHLASEYRHGAVTDVDGALAVAVSQSGETADTLAAVDRAREAGLPVLGVTNVAGSTLTRVADGILLLRAGPEISVAATKSFVSQVALLFLVGLHLSMRRGLVTGTRAQHLQTEVRQLPRAVQQILEGRDRIRAVAEQAADHDHVFYLGRHVNVGTAIEGALKLKEISYIHAEGFAGGELKHGPLALIEDGTPVVGIVAPDGTRSVMLGNLREVQARGAHVVAVAEAGDDQVERIADDVLEVPSIHPLLFPVPAGVALQLLAYETARTLDCPIDKPRNLAKSVTVE